MSKQLVEAMRLLGKTMANQIKVQGQGMDGTAIIDAEIFIPEWKPGKYEVVGQPVRQGEQVYQLLQIHDSSANPHWHPAANPALFAIVHTKDAARAKPYVAPQGISGLYHRGEICLWEDGHTYRSQVDDNAFSPVEYSQNWQIID